MSLQTMLATIKRQIRAGHSC